MDRNTDAAIRKYRNIEDLRIKLDIAEYDLEKLLRRGVNHEEYYAATEGIYPEFEAIRRSLESRGKLPK